nr:hypothetical protein [Tanacetum cinerariifolium]
MASSSNHRGKANTTRPWTTAKEITLCTAWCNAMETYGLRDITKKGFGRMFLITLRKTWEELFEKTMPSSPNEKIRFVPKLLRLVSFTMVSNGWTRTGLLTSFFSKCVSRISNY